MSTGKILESVIRGIVGVIAFCIGILGPGYIASRPLFWFGSLEMGGVVMGILLVVTLAGLLLGVFTFMPMIVLCDNGVVNLMRGFRGLFGQDKVSCAIPYPLSLQRWILAILVRYRWKNKNFQAHLAEEEGGGNAVLVFLSRFAGVALVIRNQIVAFGWIKNVFGLDFDTGVEYYPCAYSFNRGIHYIVLGYVSGISYKDSAQRGYLLLTTSGRNGSIRPKPLGKLWYDDTPPQFSVKDDEIYTETLLRSGERCLQKIDVRAGAFVAV